MSSNRIRYDKASHQQMILRSTAPAEYMLDPVRYNHEQKCRHEIGLVGGTAVSHVNANLVDVESELRGQTRPLTLCPEREYLPQKETSPFLSIYL